MVVNFLTNTNPLVQKGLATVVNATVISRVDNEQDEPTPFDNFNINDYDCCYKELALADLLDDTSWKNDKSSFLFNLSIPTDTVTIELYKCDNGEENLVATLNDDTYGTYFPASYFPNELKIGFLLDWRLVLDDTVNAGAGEYFVRADRTIINRNSQVETHIFKLRPYNEFTANETVRIHTFSEGVIEGGNDYLGFEWEQMVRLRGKFWNPQVTTESDTYENTARVIQQIQEKRITDYDLELEPINVNIAKPLIYDRLLANRILITDYNLFNYDRYLEKEVYHKEVSESLFYNRTGNGRFNFKFTDKQQNIIKRNFV